MSLRDPPFRCVSVIDRGVNRRLCYFVALYCVHAVAVPVAAQASKKLTSPTGKYSVDIIRNSQEALVFRQSGKPLAKISTPVGPVDSRFEALWSPEDSYVAINMQRSSRPGGDECGSLLCLRER